jgi:aminoglycoside phosphotransferase (APT) family kinase protein
MWLLNRAVFGCLFVGIGMSNLNAQKKRADIIMHNVLHEQMIQKVIATHFEHVPKFIKRMTIGICNEVYAVGLIDKDVIVRLSEHDKFLMGSHDHIPQFKALGIKVPDILVEDYSKTLIPLAYQIQSTIEGCDLGEVITMLTDHQLKVLAQEIAKIFDKVKTIPTNGKFGVMWGGGDNELSDTWTERMRIWIDESEEHGKKTGVMDDHLAAVAERLYITYKSYFDSVKAITYYGDICSKNVMINNGILSGLVDLDGLTQGDPLEAVGRIRLSWYGTRHGEIYSQALMDEMSLTGEQRQIVTMYALLNQISWTCNNGIQFNQNTQPVVNREIEKKDKAIIKGLVAELARMD